MADQANEEQFNTESANSTGNKELEIINKLFEDEGNLKKVTITAGFGGSKEAPQVTVDEIVSVEHTETPKKNGGGTRGGKKRRKKRRSTKKKRKQKQKKRAK